MQKYAGILLSQRRIRRDNNLKILKATFLVRR